MKTKLEINCYNYGIIRLKTLIFFSFLGEHKQIKIYFNVIVITIEAHNQIMLS